MAEDKSSAELNLSLEESDDEAPEEMTFESARNEALSRVKSALETAKREKELLKEKRRRRQELFQEQKKRRLLPIEVLDEVDAVVPKEQDQDQDEAPEEPEPQKISSTRSLLETYTVTTTKQQISFQQQAAQDFLHSRLYGPESRRSTNNELLSLQNKKGPNKQAAAQFVNKNWASKEKAKAEKLKQRWLHKQKIW
ncbi:hypothetical protein NL108_011677 [Boleophthalmus pectinirostris]|uniref:nucleolar protein 7 n=1 Tax=Boleophthalmus pectinirostris TaxID=150288 RepID=UPI00242DE9DE|nr:nucleolar protein 7 [Boleophthalmus pectinirostris]XP_055007459.1 nucleolar protein 7 [Boleophthalmus pectinirostris]XP_055007460.1 nucleolar protein 7 [Boleophthalmus pectinirostris]XP_055007462.1 nucleolar protein 7 [Boleophthalmus pectinirostris]KAJ0059263.1 hypothetical protein NL108_011677 [Boleophthalmus pectinirostris]